MAGEASTLETAVREEAISPDTVDVQMFGFWIYLMSDLILFSALFATFGVIGAHYASGPTPKEVFKMPYLFGETMLLLFSSTVYGFTTLAAHREKKLWVLLGLALAFLLGLGFVSMELNEFHGMIAKGNGPGRSAFLSAYFTLVGTHGAHVTFGLIWMAVVIGQVIFKGLTTPVKSRLMRLSMFWHFLDLIWIGIFTIVYMMGVV